MSRTLLVSTAYLVLSLAFTASAFSAPLKAHKDRLFAYPDILRQADNGDYRVVDYQELRDINNRDKVPERRVKAVYVDNAGRRATKSNTIDTPAGKVTYYSAGKRENASIITVYIHGAGGNGKQGINDFSFGGNFNRAKMLMIRNNGLYLSPDAGKFGDADAQRVKSVITNYLNASPKAKLILACGSGGGALCYRFANDSVLASNLAGIALLGSFWDNAFTSSLAAQKRVPVFIGHGSRDTIISIDKMEAFYRKLRGSNIPVQMVRFETGTHGTPIRMTDWRETITWMIAR